MVSRSPPRRTVIGSLLFPLLLTLVVATPAPAADLTYDQLRTAVEDVGAADGSVFGLTDSRGSSMRGLKVIENPSPSNDDRYVGVYQSAADGATSSDVPTSPDLVHWTWAASLANEASHPYIAAVTGDPGGYVVGVESHLGCASFFSGGIPTACL